MPNHHTGHEHYGIQAQSPVRFEHHPYLMDKYLGLVPGRTAKCAFLFFRMEKHLAFRNKNPENCRRGGNCRSCPKQRPPGMAGVRDNKQVQDSRYEVAEGISLLQYTRSKPTCFDGEILESCGRGQAPNTSHGNAEEGSHGKELMEGLDEASTKLNRGAKEEICYKWPLPAIAIGQDTEEDLQRRRLSVPIRIYFSKSDNGIIESGSLGQGRLVTVTYGLSPSKMDDHIELAKKTSILKITTEVLTAPIDRTRRVKVMAVV